MTERQRPRQAARSFRNSLTAEFVEKSETLEQIAGFFPDEDVDLRRGDAGGRDESEIDLHSRSGRDRLIRFAPGGSLLDRVEVDLQTERRLRPNRSVDRQASRRTDRMAVDGNLPQRLARACNELHRGRRERPRARLLSEGLDIPLVVARLYRLGEMRR